MYKVLIFYNFDFYFLRQSDIIDKCMYIYKFFSLGSRYNEDSRIFTYKRNNEQSFGIF